VRSWYEGIDQDTVVSAHGGVFRVLTAFLNLVEPESASVGNVGQGCVYVFNDKGMGHYE
jgi:broad specificity phosphatase PhoE